MEICEISIRQNKASINAFLICLLPSAADARHPLAQVHGAKVHFFFELRKKKIKKKCHLCEFGTNGICFRELH